MCRYGIPWHQALKACLLRDIKLTKRDRFNYYSRTFQISYLAFLSATAFIKPGKNTLSEGNLFLLELFFAALISIFAGFGKVPPLVTAGCQRLCLSEEIVWLLSIHILCSMTKW